ncbi:WD40-repeat-containing domain protein [Fennellomyces sp. T-0311]|nr:WD40-repeat-containing domain protein [Fennellomyces sp. T-0311]
MDPRRPNPIPDLYGEEGMTPGRSLADPRLSYHRNVEVAPLQRHRSGLDLSQLVEIPRGRTLTRQQSEGGGPVSRRDLARRNVPTLGRERPLRRSYGGTLARSQTEIRLPRDSSILITRSRSRSPLRWSAMSRQGSSLSNTDAPASSASSHSEPSSWRRFSSSLARIWGRSNSENNNNSRSNTDCFPDCVENPSSQSTATATASSSSQAVEEATIPANEAPAAAAPIDHSEDEDPDPLLCPICRDLLNSVAVTVCGHTFCYPCISQYISTSPDCPICRSRLTQQQILPNYQFSDLVEQYREGKQRGTQSMIRPVRSDSKRQNVAMLETLLKDMPYKDALALLLPAFNKKRQEEVDRKMAESLLLEEFLSKLKEKHRNAMIENDLSRAKGKRPETYENDSDANPLSTDAIVLSNGEGSSSSIDNATAPTDASLRRSGHKRKIQETLGLGDALSGDNVSQAKRQRLYERFEDLHEVYLKEACTDEHPLHYDLDKFSSLLYETTRYSSFRVLDTMFHNDSTSSSIISSIEFDRDDEFFAIGGVSREIKIFDTSMIAQASPLENDAANEEWPRGVRDLRGSGFIGHFQPSQLIHCPVKIISVGQKLSCLSWNMYVKSHIASSDYEGTIRLWDVNEGQAIRTFDEHERRTWSVDMCAANPTYLASGGDDSTVKIWSTSASHSVMTLPFNGNVCCAKFAPSVANFLAVGTADHTVTCYDLRYTGQPLRTFNGHKKAVSYVRWLDDKQIISASTDNTLRRWNMNGDCKLTYKGHTNEKNFVGLSVSKDWISCGSEDNSLYTYHKDCRTPIARYRFPATPVALYDQPYTPEEEPLPSGFVSSTCWKGESNIMLAANSKGIIKVLQLD